MTAGVWSIGAGGTASTASDPPGEFSSLGDFGDCFNPTSEGNLPHQAADTVGDAVGVDLPGVVANPVTVDIAAGAVCVGTAGPACVGAIAVAFGHATTMTVAEGFATDWCDPGQLLAQEAVNGILAWGATLQFGIKALAPDAPTYIERMLQSGMPACKPSLTTLRRQGDRQDPLPR